MKIHKTFTGILVLTLGLMLSGVSQAAPSAEAVYKEAYTAEAVDRDPAKAINLYKEVLGLTADQSPLAAKAHLRLGICFEKLGQTSAALDAYQAVLNMPEAPSAISQQAREQAQRLQPASEPTKQSTSNHSYSRRTERQWSMSIAGGVAKPMGKNPNEITNSPTIKVGLTWDAASWFSLGIEGGYSFGHDNGAYKREITQLTPVLQIGPWGKTPFGMIRPYLVLGGGLYNVKESHPENRYLGSDEINYGFNAGGGLLFRIGESVGFGPDIRFHDVLASGASPFQYLSTEAKIAFYF